MPMPNIEELKSELDEKGYCTIEGLLPEACRAEALELLEQMAASQDKAAGIDQAQADDINQVIFALVTKGQPFVDMARNETIMELVRHVIGEEFLLSSSASVIAHPGGSCMSLHSDQWWLPRPYSKNETPSRTGSMSRFDPPSGGDHRPLMPASACTVMWMVTPFTDPNGATRIVPGSHLSGDVPDPVVPYRVDTVPAVGPAGSAVIFDARLWHATGVNTTNQSRYGVVMGYCGPQFRPMENYTISAPDALLADADPLLLQLLGFKVWNGYGKIDSASADFVMRPEHSARH